MSNDKLTPLKAVRKNCLWCCADQPAEVRLCPVEACALHEYRMGKRPESPKLTPIKAIRARCRDCCGETWADVRDCPGFELDAGPCPLYPYRLGKNPYVSSEAREAARRRAQDQFLGEIRGRSKGFQRVTAEGWVFGRGDGLKEKNPPLVGL